MSTVVNAFGVEINYNEAESMMNGALRALMNIEREWDSEQEFFDAYAERHQQAFGGMWYLAGPNPQY